MLEGHISFFEDSGVAFGESPLGELVNASIRYLYVHRISFTLLLAILNRPQVLHFLAISLSISLGQLRSLGLTPTNMSF